MENGTETVVTAGANAAFGNASLSGGDGGSGPLRGGIFAASVDPLDDAATQRQNAGASYYGVMELSGNLWERVATVGNDQGRGFEGTHGDGHLTTHAGDEGNATNLAWPGIVNILDAGVVSAGGSGARGGGWLEDDDQLRVSDRSVAAKYEKYRLSSYGFRAVRTAPQN